MRLLGVVLIIAAVATNVRVRAQFSGGPPA
jgi:hypothetical protein